MKAWTLDQVGRPVRCAEVPDPVATRGGVVIRVLAAHVPAYTRELTSGERGYRLDTPMIIGPTCVGVVESVGDEVFNVEPGNLVLAGAPLRAGSSGYSPEEILVGWTGAGRIGARTPKVLNMLRTWHDGTFAELALCAKETLVRLSEIAPSVIEPAVAFVPWLAIGAAALRRADMRVGHSVLVIGATGQLGGAVTMMALAAGASRVVAAGRSRSALDRLARIDTRIHTVELSMNADQNMATFLADTDGQGADVAIDALGHTPNTDLTQAGLMSLRPRGTLVLIGGITEALPIPYSALMRKQLTIRGSFMWEPEDAVSVWRSIQAGLIDLANLEVDVVGIGDPEAALSIAAETAGLRFCALVPRTSGIHSNA